MEVFSCYTSSKRLVINLDSLSAGFFIHVLAVQVRPADNRVLHRLLPCQTDVDSRRLKRRDGTPVRALGPPPTTNENCLRMRYKESFLCTITLLAYFRAHHDDFTLSKSQAIRSPNILFDDGVGI